MSEVTRALEQIEAIHDHLARGHIYRGWRPVPVAASGLVGLGAAAWQPAVQSAPDANAFAMFWLVAAAVAMAIGCAEIVWHYAWRARAVDRRQTRFVLGQFLPALVAGLVASFALLSQPAPLVGLLPGLWALLFGVGIFAASPCLPRGSRGVALFYWTAGVGLLVAATGTRVPSPWSVGLTFGLGQLLAAAVLAVGRERTRHVTTTDF
ncbi:MAG: hypothetical protein R2752_20400 [Vicinamibacterales bacterium]